MGGLDQGEPHGFRVERDDTAPTVFECFAVMFPGFRTEADDPALVGRVVGTATLSDEWLGSVVHRNPHAGTA